MLAAFFAQILLQCNSKDAKRALRQLLGSHLDIGEGEDKELDWDGKKELSDEGKAGKIGIFGDIL